jgi:hypothetical protein
MARPVRLALPLIARAGLAACARPQARVPEPPAPLTVPEPPPRTVIPVTLPDVVEPPPPPTPVDPEPPTTSGAGVKPTGKTPEKPAPPPATPPQPSETPTPVLQTADASQLERKARTLIDSAEAHLAQVNERALSPAARGQYQYAKSFVRQARAALTAKNFHYATQLADNANILARLLAKR